MSFDQLGLSPAVLDAVKAAGFTQPTPIQSQAIPPALEGRDILGLAQTGSGKTAAFTLPMLTWLERGRARARMPRALVLEPTRELAFQVHEALETLGQKHKLTVALLIGGVSFDQQDKKIDRGADVVIATPGRLLDHFQRGKLMLNAVEFFVVDEADRMLDMGFIPDIEEICKLLPVTRQTLFFSATMPAEIQRLTNTFLHNPVKLEAAPPATTAASIEQFLVPADSNEPHAKRACLRTLLNTMPEVKNAIVFANRKDTVRVLERSLIRHGFNAAALHGDMDQHSRLQTLDRFRKGEITYLVASDVAARGLDIPAVSHIFNYDVPIHADDYVHRIGRTGRAGRKGHAFMLVTRQEKKHVSAIEKLIRREIPWQGDRPSTDDAPPDKKPVRGRRVRDGEPSKTSSSSDMGPAEKSRPPKDAKPKDAQSKDAKRKGRHNKEPVMMLDQEHVPAFLQRSVR